MFHVCKLNYDTYIVSTQGTYNNDNTCPSKVKTENAVIG